MQFKIILACNEYLHRTKIRDNPRCNTCNSLDNLEHFLFECPKTNEFWKKIANRYNQITKNDLNLDYKTVLLGPKPSNILLAGLVVHGKWYIYSSKIASTSISFNSFLVKLKYDLLVEKMGILISPMNNRLGIFNNTWGWILQ